MAKASFDRSRVLELFARIGEAGVAIVLVFVDENGDAYPISTFDWRLPVRRRSTDVDELFELTLGDGLTVIGASLNKLQIELSAVRANQLDDIHFWQLIDDNEDHTWLNGPFTFHNGEFDGVDETTEIVVSETTEVTITIESPGINPDGLVRIQGTWDASVNLFPSSSVLKGYWYKISVAGTLGGVGVEPGAKIMALVDAPGQTLTNWDMTY